MRLFEVGALLAPNTFEFCFFNMPNNGITAVRIMYLFDTFIAITIEKEV